MSAHHGNHTARLTQDAVLPAPETDLATLDAATPERENPDDPRGLARRFHAIELDRHIGERLRFVRRISCLSQRHVADEVGLSFQQVQKYENGTNRVAASLLAEFAGLFHVPMDWFIGPFNACMQPEPRPGANAPHHATPGGDYPYVLDRLYRALRDRSDGECDTALDILCQVANVGAGPRETRLFRLWRAMRDSPPGSNALLLEVVGRLEHGQARPVAWPNDATPSAPVAATPSGSGAVLLVDDDRDVLAMLTASLASAGLTVMTAMNGNDALRILASAARIDVLVTDYAMVGMDGVELVKQAGQIRPGLPGIVITGFADAGRLNELPPGVEVLSKPFRRMELIGRVRLLLERRPDNRERRAVPAGNAAGA